MPKFNFSIPHSLSTEEAKGRLDRFIEALEAKADGSVADLEKKWEDNALVFGFKTYGIKIGGRMTIEEDKVVIDGDLPISAMMFKGKIESEIKKQLDRLLQA